MDSTTPDVPPVPGGTASPAGRYRYAGMSRPSWVGNRTSSGSTKPVGSARTGAASVSQRNSPASRSTSATLFGRVPVDSSSATRRPSSDTDSAVITPVGNAGTARSRPAASSRARSSDAPSTFTAQTSTCRSPDNSAPSTSHSELSTSDNSPLAGSRATSASTSRPESVTRKSREPSADQPTGSRFASSSDIRPARSPPATGTRYGRWSVLLRTSTTHRISLSGVHGPAKNVPSVATTRRGSPPARSSSSTSWSVSTLSFAAYASQRRRLATTGGDPVDLVELVALLVRGVHQRGAVRLPGHRPNGVVGVGREPPRRPAVGRLHHKVELSGLVVRVRDLAAVG